MSQAGFLISSNLKLVDNFGAAIGPDANQKIAILGAAGMTVTGDPITHTLTITGAGVGSITFHTDAGDANPALNQLTLAGGVNISTTGAASTATFNLINDPIIGGDLVVVGNMGTVLGNVTGFNLTTVTNPAMTLTMNENGLYSGGTDVDVDVSVTTKGEGDFVIDCLLGAPVVAQWRTGQESTTTVNATKTVLVEIDLAVETMIALKATVNGFRDNYLNALSGDLYISAYRPTGGDVTILGAKIVSSSVDAAAAVTVETDCDVHVGTQTVRVYVTGAAAQNWLWASTFSYMYTAHP